MSCWKNLLEKSVFLQPAWERVQHPRCQVLDFCLSENFFKNPRLSGISPKDITSYGKALDSLQSQNLVAWFYTKETSRKEWDYLTFLAFAWFGFTWFWECFPEDLYLHYCGLSAATFWSLTLFWTSVSILDIKETCPNILNLEHIEESPFQ